MNDKKKKLGQLVTQGSHPLTKSSKKENKEETFPAFERFTHKAHIHVTFYLIKWWQTQNSHQHQSFLSWGQYRLKFTKCCLVKCFYMDVRFHNYVIIYRLTDSFPARLCM